MTVVAVSSMFNAHLGELEHALFLARQGDPSAALRALQCAEAGFRGDSLQADGDFGVISMMKQALQVRIEFAFPVDDAFWETVDFIDHRADLSNLRRKIARRSLKAIMISMPSPSEQIAAWVATADTELTSAEIDEVLSGV